MTPMQIMQSCIYHASLQKFVRRGQKQRALTKMGTCFGTPKAQTQIFVLCLALLCRSGMFNVLQRYCGPYCILAIFDASRQIGPNRVMLWAQQLCK